MINNMRPSFMVTTWLPDRSLRNCMLGHRPATHIHTCTQPMMHLQSTTHIIEYIGIYHICTKINSCQCTSELAIHFSPRMSILLSELVCLLLPWFFATRLNICVSLGIIIPQIYTNMKYGLKKIKINATSPTFG